MASDRLKLFISFVSAVTALVAITVAGCMKDATQYPVETYRGDGKMIDRGQRAAAERFNLHLGEIDFSKEKTLTFRMSNLPAVRFVIGFDLRDMPPLLPRNSDGKDFNRAKVHILLETSGGDKVLEDASPLAAWTWSGNMHGTRRFVYLRGAFGAEGGGSSFIPEPQQQYVLTVRIEPLPGSKAVKPAELRVTGGGWKVP
jgi:hypothetical protein